MPYLTYNQKESILDDISNKMFYRSIGDKYSISHTFVEEEFHQIPDLVIEIESIICFVKTVCHKTVS